MRGRVDVAVFLQCACRREASAEAGVRKSVLSVEDQVLAAKQSGTRPRDRVDLTELLEFEDPFLRELFERGTVIEPYFRRLTERARGR